MNPPIRPVRPARPVDTAVFRLSSAAMWLAILRPALLVGVGFGGIVSWTIVLFEPYPNIPVAEFLPAGLLLFSPLYLLFAGMVVFFGRQTRAALHRLRHPAREAFRLVVDDHGVTLRTGAGREERIAWSEVRTILSDRHFINEKPRGRFSLDPAKAVFLRLGPRRQRGRLTRATLRMRAMHRIYNALREGELAAFSLKYYEAKGDDILRAMRERHAKARNPAAR